MSKTKLPAIPLFPNLDSLLPRYQELPDHPVMLRDLLRDTAILFLGFGKGFAVLMPMLGKVIAHVQRTGLWEAWGFKTFTDFVTHGMEKDFKVPHSQAWACYRLVEKWPSMTPQEAVEIGYVKLRELSRVSHEGDSKAEEWKHKAKEMPVEQFKDLVSTARGSTVAQDKLVRLEFHVRQETKDLVLEVMESIGREISTDDPNAIFEAWAGEWESRNR